jgi:hypothetical protein
MYRTYSIGLHDYGECLFFPGLPEPNWTVESYVTADGQSASLSWNKAPIWGLRPDFYYYCQTFAGLFIWGAVSDERIGLSFTIVTGPRQHSHSRVRVPWDLRPYVTVSGLRLPFLSPSTTRRATVEIFYPASTREELNWILSGADHIENNASNTTSTVARGPLPSSGCLLVVCLAVVAQ